MAAPLMFMSREILAKFAQNPHTPLSGVGISLTKYPGGIQGGVFHKRPLSFACRQFPVCVTLLSRAYTKKAYDVPVSSLKQRLVRRLMIALGVGVAGGCSVAGAAYSFKSEDEHKKLTLPGAESTERLKFKPDRRIRSSTDKTGLKLTLYQYQTCPFCCKVRAYLDYRGFSYDVVEVNSVRRNQIKWSKYKKVPILVLEGPNVNSVLQMNDSSLIISALESFLLDQSQTLDTLLTYYPEMETQNTRGKTVFEYPNKYFLMHGKASGFTEARKEEQKWRQWTDDILVHVLSPNIYRTPSQSLEAFKAFSVAGEWDQTFNIVERYFIIAVGAFVMYFIGNMLQKKYKLKADVRQSLYDACNEWTDALSKSGDTFMGGKSPNLADLAVYGELNAIEGCLAFRDMMFNTQISSWYIATKKAIASNAGQRLR